jgi:hypothetical protein
METENEKLNDDGDLGNKNIAAGDRAGSATREIQRGTRLGGVLRCFSRAPA